MSEHDEDEWVSIALIPEDLRYLLLIASLYLHQLRERGVDDPKLERAIHRIGSSSAYAEWQQQPSEWQWQQQQPPERED